VDIHQSSTNTRDLHSLGFIKSFLQAFLCQQISTKEVMK